MQTKSDDSEFHMTLRWLCLSFGQSEDFDSAPGGILCLVDPFAGSDCAGNLSSSQSNYTDHSTAPPLHREPQLLQHAWELRWTEGQHL